MAHPSQWRDGRRGRSPVSGGSWSDTEDQDSKPGHRRPYSPVAETVSIFECIKCLLLNSKKYCSLKYIIFVGERYLQFVLNIWLFAAVPEGPDLRDEAPGQRAAGGRRLLAGAGHVEAGVGARGPGPRQAKRPPGATRLSRCPVV